MYIIGLINKYPQLIDDIHKFIQSKTTNENIISNVRKNTSGTILSVEYSTKHKTGGEYTSTKIEHDIWCHFLYSKVNKNEIMELIKKYLRDIKIDELFLE